ncbi:MAG: CPBP family intramembrane metalloprotease [Calditrichaeota bacterium]|nr:CPBP family intramembrane metalloprotease [Calditrichota bacterium]
MFLERAKEGSNNFWRYLVSIIAVVAMLFIGQIPLGIVLVSAQLKGYDISQFTKNMDFDLLGINPNIGLILIVLSFAAGLLGLFLVVKYIHNKTFSSIITGFSKIRWSRVFYAFGLWFILSAIAELIFYYNNPDLYVFQFDAGLFIPLVFVSLIFLPLQTSFEEIFIRGYLMQAVGLIGYFRWVPLLVSSLIFGGLHFMNPEVAEYGMGLMMVYYIGFGIFMAVITLMDEGLELALGIHALQNIYSSVFVGYKGGALQTPSLFMLTELNTQAMLVSWLVVSILFLFIVSRKYEWKNWGKLFGKIEFNQNP